MRLVVIASVVLLSGCLATDGPSSTTPATPVVSSPSVVHVATGDTLNESVVDGLLPQLPIATSRYLGAGAFEPTLGVDAEGVLFYSAYNYENPEDGDVFRSFDQGRTWQEVSPAIAGQQYPPASNDNYVHVDVSTGRVFSSDLQALMCSTLSFSDDQAETWTTNPIGCGHPMGVHDHQTVWTAKPRVLSTMGYPNLVHYCVNRVVDTACASSTNGGLSFGPLRPLVFHPIPSVAMPAACGGTTGHGVAASDGTIYIAMVSCGTPIMARSVDDGLTWTLVEISDVEGEQHDVHLAVDDAGHVHALWLGPGSLPYLASSMDGLAFGPARMIAPARVQSTDFLTLDAGTDGRVIAAYYGTTQKEGADQTWNAYLTLSTNALGDVPVFATVTANDPADPIARGDCSFENRCSGVGDFIDVFIDGEGRPWAAFVDVCNEACATGEADENTGVEGFAATLLQGPALRGAAGPLPALLE